MFRVSRPQRRVFSSFSGFFKVFQCFFKVFPCFFGFFQGFSEEGLPPRPFHSLILVKGGSYFWGFKGEIVFGKCEFLVLKSRVLDGLSFSGFLCFSSFSRLFRDLFHNDFGQAGSFFDFKGK